MCLSHHIKAHPTITILLQSVFLSQLKPLAVPPRKMFSSTDTQKNGEQQFLIKKVFEVAGIKLRTSKSCMLTTRHSHGPNSYLHSPLSLSRLVFGWLRCAWLAGWQNTEGVSELASPTTMTRRFQISFSSLDFDLLSMCVVQIGRLELSWQQQGSDHTMNYW